MLFNAQIITADKRIFEGEISSLVVPSELGYLGVLADHAPLIANLRPGKITFRDNSGFEKEIINKGKGFIEVIRNKATILLDSV